MFKKILEKPAYTSLILSIIFFCIIVATLPSYGVNWDTINHLPRGQAYLNYFLTGNKNYSNLVKYNPYFQNPEYLNISSINGVNSRSYYAIDAADFDWFMQYDGNGHPPLSDILAAASNKLFFGKLRIINDIDAHRVYAIFLTTILVGLVYFLATSLYGRIAGFFSSLILMSYPLFFSEVHFNTEKDIPETFYFSTLILSIWYAFTKKSIPAAIMAGIIFGFGLGTKFNILFSSLVIIPWIVIFLLKKYFGDKDNLTELFKKYWLIIIALIISFLVGLIIFVASWPYLWPDPVTRISGVVNFYKDIGTTETFDSRFIGPLGINLYPIIAIILTTPIAVIILFALGLLFAFMMFKKEKDLHTLLILLWFFIPLIRVTWPGSNIYGGLRQIMEYIPAMAIISGLGIAKILERFKFNEKLFPSIISLIVCILIIYPTVKYHPNQNTFFNPLIGGLDGAKKINFPYWGNSFGASYRQAAVWLNKNAPDGSTVVLARELSPNMPKIWLRPDLLFDNRMRSGPAMKGEYAVALIYQGVQDRSYYDAYLERFLKPVYEVRVDNTAILKIWKNEEKYLISNFSQEEIKDKSVTFTNSTIMIDLKNSYQLAKVNIIFSDTNCSQKLDYAFSEVSNDGHTWKRIAGTMPGEDWNVNAFGEQPQKNSFVQPFAKEQAKFVRYYVSPSDSCLLKVQSVKVYKINSK
ncbi:glycosyltransferase family 39 protein [Candidatus Microgenomates bacterium]|nr:glycosyltransferase family 39 protein [Candidatus Microgenomates bacterium]